MDKPFLFGAPVDENHFIGREDEIKRLSNNFKYGVNTILISPRRWGKTSLVNKVAETVVSENTIVVKTDVFSCRNEYDFYNLVSAAVLKQTGSNTEVGITSKTHTPEEVLDLPKKIAQRKGCHIILCIDEFQQVGWFPNSLSFQKRLRTAWQHQNNVSYCLSGSKMNMMTNLFQKKNYPFYKFGDTMYLQPIPLKDWIVYISSRFEREKKHISDDLIQKLCESVGYQSSYVQQLAYCTLLLTNKTVTDEVLNQALDYLVNQNSGIFIEQVESLTTYQMNFLRAILSGINNGFGEKTVRENYDLGVPSNIARLKKSLIDKELVQITENGFVISDPVLKIWLQKVV